MGTKMGTTKDLEIGARVHHVMYSMDLKPHHIGVVVQKTDGPVTELRKTGEKFFGSLVRFNEGEQWISDLDLARASEGR